MRMSELFGQTLRKAPAGASSEALALLMRGGFLRRSAAGVFSFLPLGARVIGRMRELARMDVEGQEVLLPADSAEQQVAALAHSEIGSFRQLPRLLLQFKPLRREKEDPSAGLVRFREKQMLCGYVLAAEEPELDRRCRQHLAELQRVLDRCSLPVREAAADPADPAAPRIRQLVFLISAGGEEYLTCDDCGYLAHRQAAGFARQEKSGEPQAAVEKVATPEAHTMRALAEQLEVPLAKTAKAVFLMAALGGAAAGGRETFVVAALRGDRELNEAKLQAHLDAASLRPAVEEEIRRWGIEPGYGSPVGVKGVRLVVDEEIPNCVNLVAGANEPGYHLLNVNYGRDFSGGEVADIALAAAGDPCPGCGRGLELVRGIPLVTAEGRDRGICERSGATFQDREGANRPVRMGLLSLDLGTLLVCAAEQHRDAAGLRWPASLSPYDVHIVKLTKSGEAAEQVYEQLQAEGLEVLFDEREESAGVKFNDADLIGIPIRLTIGDRSLQAGGVELKLRSGEEKILVPLEEVIPRILEGCGPDRIRRQRGGT